MLTIDIIAVGKLKNGPFYDLYQDYTRRINWLVKLHEIDVKTAKSKSTQAEEEKQINALIHDSAFTIILDERGNGLRSLDFAKTLQNFKEGGERHIQFIIGGADGLTDETRGRANLLLSFGQQTWPHMMARVMLIEQIYRAQQIIARHPYHRE